MRVVAGIAKGRRLTAPKGEGTRPTSDFVREAIFNVLTSHLDLEGARVLDLFAGTGALGIEALSRGASHATFMESDRDALAAIRENLQRTGLGDRATVLSGDLLQIDLPQIDARVDLAFADPPYVFDGWTDLLGPLLGRLRPGLAVLESDREIDLGDAWEVLKVKKYGSTVVTLTSPRSCQ